MINRSLLDGLNFLSKTSPSRLLNSLKVVCSFYSSKWSGKVYHWGMPVSLSFEPTTSCNLRCPECPSGLRSFTRSTGMLDKNLFEKILNEVGDKLWYLILYFQGEPYLHPHFFDLVKHASSKNIYTATSTNAHYLNDENSRKTIESGLDRLIISIDGTTQETYSSYRIGGNLDKVLKGTKNIIEWKKKLKSNAPHIIFQFLVVKPNEHQIAEVEKLAKELGVDEVGFKTAQIYDYENGSPLIPDNEKYSRYKKQPDGTFAIKNKLLNHCWKLWHSCVITWDGNIVPCCFDKDAEFKMGSLKGNSFESVWQNEEYNNFRASILRSRSENEMCRNCTEGMSPWAG